jgi:hypothetical protein
MTLYSFFFASNLIKISAEDVAQLVHSPALQNNDNNNNNKPQIKNINICRNSGSSSFIL